MDTKFAK